MASTNMNVLDRVYVIFYDILSFIGLGEKAQSLVVAAPVRKEIFEVKSTEYFTDLSHVENINKELYRVRSFLRSSYGLSWKQERDISNYINCIVAFKAALRLGHETARVTRSKGNVNWRYAIEIFDSGNEFSHAASYTIEINKPRRTR